MVGVVPERLAVPTPMITPPEGTATVRFTVKVPSAARVNAVHSAPCLAAFSRLQAVASLPWMVVRSCEPSSTV